MVQAIKAVVNIAINDQSKPIITLGRNTPSPHINAPYPSKFWIYLCQNLEKSFFLRFYILKKSTSIYDMGFFYHKGCKLLCVLNANKHIYASINKKLFLSLYNIEFKKNWLTLPNLGFFHPFVAWGAKLPPPP